MLVRDTVPSTRIALDTRSLAPDILAVDITHPVTLGGIRLVCIYRPPCTSSAQSARLLDICSTLSSVPHQLAYLGDVNCNIHWDSPGVLTGFSSSLFDFAASLSLSQVVPSPTRKDRFLDIMLASEGLVTSCSVIAPFSSSDHSSFIFSLNFPISTPIFSSSLNYKKIDFEALSLELSSFDWFTLLDNSFSIHDMYDRFVSILVDSLAAFAPLNRTRLPFDSYPPHIKKLLKHKQLLFTKLDLSGVPSQFQAASLKLDQEIRKFQRNRENAAFSRPIASSTRFYSYVSSRLKTKPRSISLLGPSGVPLASDPERCELLADYFSSVYTVDNDTLPVLCSTVTASCPSPIILPFMVAKVLRSLKPSCSLPVDSIPPIIYKHCSDALSLPLSIIYNFSLNCGQVPDLWKRSIVVPIPKTNSPSEPSDYRPISLTPTASKVLERLVKVTLVEWCTTHDLIPPHQHGFVARRSVTSQLLELTQRWKEAIDVGQVVDVVYVDFAKAFDSVSFPKLLAKLESFGVRGPLLSWFSSFLVGRTFQVKIGSSLSFPQAVVSGVPQGSVLGPFLFLLFISDIGNITTALPLVDIRLFADDLKIFAQFDPRDPMTATDQLQSSLRALETYCTTWQLKIAAHKCAVLHIGSSNPRLPLTLSSVALPTVDVVRDLGVLLDTRLSFSPHIDKLVARTTSLVYSVFRTLSSSLPSVYIQTYKTFLIPILDFASPVWSPHTSKHIAKLESVQRLFTRLLFHRCSRLMSPQIPSYEGRLSATSLIPLRLRRVLVDIITAVKILRGSIDVQVSTFFVFRPTLGRTNFYGITVRKSNTKSLRHSFSFRSTTFLLKYNRIISLSLSIPTLKQHLLTSLSVL